MACIASVKQGGQARKEGTTFTPATQVLLRSDTNHQVRPTLYPTIHREAKRARSKTAKGEEHGKPPQLSRVRIYRLIFSAGDLDDLRESKNYSFFFVRYELKRI